MADVAWPSSLAPKTAQISIMVESMIDAPSLLLHLASVVEDIHEIT